MVTGLVTTSNPQPIALPAARVDIVVRAGTDADIDFIDALQKKNNKQLGFMNRPTLEGKVRLGHVLIAETSSGQRAGYLIGNDRYKHRDELGVIFQLCVAPEFRRSLVAANLLKAQFERSAYGCKLYCCWCAQDIEANRFWESMGFVPLAFRAGSAKKDRVHIFWQKRIREGDTTTPWWFPSETSGGMMGAARIALPIPPGMHWTDELPRLLPRETPALALPAIGKKPRAKSPSAKSRVSGGLYFGPRKTIDGNTEKPVKVKKPKKNDPALAAKARELRDRWIEKISDDPSLLASARKYEVNKTLAAPEIEVVAAFPILPVVPAPIAA
jgi:ribosomal protein S18 acetylase RimI-like enzyme